MENQESKMLSKKLTIQIRGLPHVRVYNDVTSLNCVTGYSILWPPAERKVLEI